MYKKRDARTNRCCFADLTQAKTETQAPKQKHASRKQKHTAECQNGNTKQHTKQKHKIET